MIILDIEASGTEYAVHSIVSIGAVDFSKPERRFYLECKIWEGAHIMDGALEVNGFTREQILDPAKISEAEAVQQFLEWTQQSGDRTLVGQNVSFDRDFVRAASSRAHHAYDLPYRTLDTHTMAYMHMVKRGFPAPIDAQHRRSSLNLDAVLLYCGIPEEPDPHNALTGALCHAEVTARLLYDKKLLPEFAQYAIPWH
jgi:DNA polymerase III epsilon subunit-like protein